MSSSTTEAAVERSRAGPRRIAVSAAAHQRSGLREFLIIVLGVLTALAADAARKYVVERGTEHEYIARLQDELTHGRERIVYNQGRVGAAIGAIDTLLAMKDRGRNGPAVARLAIRAGDYEFNQAGIVFDNTYREMLSTGTLSLIRDLDTRNGLTRYYHVAYRAGDVANESKERTQYFANLVRAAVGEAPSNVIDTHSALAPDAEARLVAIFAGSSTIDDELRLLRSRLKDRSLYLRQLVTGTDTILRILKSD
jgi:hypothetical protein